MLKSSVAILFAAVSTPLSKMLESATSVSDVSSALIDLASINVPSDFLTLLTESAIDSSAVSSASTCTVLSDWSALSFRTTDAFATVSEAVESAFTVTALMGVAPLDLYIVTVELGTSEEVARVAFTVTTSIVELSDRLTVTVLLPTTSVGIVATVLIKFPALSTRFRLTPSLVSSTT